MFFLFVLLVENAELNNSNKEKKLSGRPFLANFDRYLPYFVLC